MTFMSATRLLTSSLVYELTGLGGKGACHQVWHSELKPQNPEGGKRDQLPSWIDIFHVPSLQMWLVFVLGLSFYTSDLFWLVYSGLITIPFPLPLVCRTLSLLEHVPISYSLELSCQISWFTLFPESFFVCWCAWPPSNMHMHTCIPPICMYAHTNIYTDRHLSIKLMQNSIKVKSSFRTSWLHNNIDSFQPGACCDIYSSLLKTPFIVI